MPHSNPALSNIPGSARCPLPSKLPRCEEATKALGEIFPNVRRNEDVLILDTDDGAELIRPIRTVLSRLSITPTEVRFRQRTLEDLFIELTGRKLRE